MKLFLEDSIELLKVQQSAEECDATAGE